MKTFLLTCIVGLLVSPFYLAGAVVVDDLLAARGALSNALIQAYIGGVFVMAAVLARRNP